MSPGGYLDNVRLTKQSLVKMVVAIFAGFFLVALGWSLVRESLPELDHADRVATRLGFERAEPYYMEPLLRSPGDREAWMRYLSQAVIHARAVAPMRPSSYLTSEYQRLSDFSARSTSIPPLALECFVGHFLVPQRGNWRARLEELNSQPGFLVLGFLHELEHDPDPAGEAFRRAWKLDPDDALALESFQRVALWSRNADWIQESGAEPTARDGSDWHEFSRGLANPDVSVWDHFRSVVAREWHPDRWPEISAALIVGICWWILFLHMVTVWTMPRRWFVITIPAVALGILSALITLAVITAYPEAPSVNVGSFSDTANIIIENLMVGVREELLKFLCFLPIVPVLLRYKATSLQALLTASCVGLGFAVAENVNYFDSSLGMAAASRFLTANFFHMILTGYAGVHFVLALQGARQGWNAFLNALGSVIVVHGAYDLFITLGEGWSLAAFIILVLSIRHFLRLILGLRPAGRRRVSLTRALIACLAVTIGVNYLMMASVLGLWAAAPPTGQASIGGILIIFAYFAEFQEAVPAS